MLTSLTSPAGGMKSNTIIKLEVERQLALLPANNCPKAIAASPKYKQRRLKK